MNNPKTIFDATRDNKGKGVKSRDLLRIFKKIDTGEVVIDSIKIRRENTYKNL